MLLFHSLHKSSLLFRSRNAISHLSWVPCRVISSSSAYTACNIMKFQRHAFIHVRKQQKPMCSALFNRMQEHFHFVVFFPEEDMSIISVFSGSCSNQNIYCLLLCLFDLIHGRFFSVSSSILFFRFSLPFFTDFPPF